MTFKIDYWDPVSKSQKQRDSTLLEDIERDADLAANAVPVVPARVPMLNAHLVLIDAGWMAAIDGYIDALPEPDRSKARTYLAMALTMERTHPLVLGIPAALGKTEAEVDALFIQAAALSV